jgi:hypothetical protein
MIGEVIKWNGGECPVNDFDIVRVTHVDGDVVEGEAYGFLWEINNETNGMKIKEYKLLKVAAVYEAEKHSHYFKDCPYSRVDIYRVLELFGVTDQALGHAIKKLLVNGGRGAGKDSRQDVQEAVDTLKRWLEMEAEKTAFESGAA